MKKIMRLSLLIIAISLFTMMSGISYGQKIKADEVPGDITQSMEFEHPSAKISGWSLENNNFVASFKEDGASGKAYFANDGKWIKSMYSIPKSEIPPAINDYIKKNYPTYIISTTALQSTPEERMHYYVEVKPDGIGQEISYLTFSDIGTLISRKDPPGFGETATKTAENKPKESTEKTVSKNTPKPAPSKPAATSPSKSQSQNAKVKQPEKPVAQKPAERAQAEEKKENKKKEKPVKPVTDEFGNVALAENEVPAIVKTALSKKIQRPENLHWFKIDTFYVAKCLFREQKNEVFITPKGTWEKTYTHIGETSVTGNMLKHLNSFYNGWRFKQAVKEVRADKQDRTMVEIYEKNNYKDKLVTTVIFDKTGKLIRSIDPNYQLGNASSESGVDADLEKYYEKMSMGMNDDEEIPVEVLNGFRAKYPRITNPQWSRDEDGNYLATYMGTRGKEISVVGMSGALLQTHTIGNPDLLSSHIQSYIKQNHKGFKVDEYYAVRDLQEKKNYYKVFISNKKTKEEFALWFTTAGKIIER